MSHTERCEQNETASYLYSLSLLTLTYSFSTSEAWDNKITKLESNVFRKNKELRIM